MFYIYKYHVGEETTFFQSKCDFSIQIIFYLGIINVVLDINLF